MIPRAAVARSVCIQCQFRFLNGGLKPRNVPFPRQPLRQYSSETPWDRLNQALKEHEKPQPRPRPAQRKAFKPSPTPERTEEPSSERPDVSNTEAPDSSIETPNEAPEGTIHRADDGTVQQPNKKERGARVHRGRVGSRRVTLSPEELSVDILGQKAHTIVMRDDQRPSKSRIIEEALVEDENSVDTSAELRELIDGIKDKASLNEAYTNIDELRPENRLLSANEFWVLFETLAEGFTRPQLSHYIKKHSKNGTPEGTGADVPQRRPWMARPITFRPLDALEEPSKPGKHRMAYTLMLKAWDLDIWERVEGINEVVVPLTEQSWAHLEARHQGSDFAVELGRGLIQAGESVVASNSINEIRILARKSAGQAVLDRIRDSLEGAFEEAFTLFPPRPRLPVAELNRGLLRNLGALTQTALTLEESGKLDVLSWDSAEDSQQAAEHAWESKAHVIWRLLRAGFLPASSTSIIDPTFLPRVPGRLSASQKRLGLKRKQADDLRLIPSAEESERWPWRHRLQSWSRWVLPTGRSVSRPTSHRYRFGRRKGLRRHDVDGPKAVIRALSTKLATSTSIGEREASQSLWSQPEDAVSATFGHVLLSHSHDTITARSLGLTQSGGVLESPSYGMNRLFSPSTPPPAGLTSLDALKTATPAAATLILRFAAGSDWTKPLLQAADGKLSMSNPSQPLCTIEVHLAIPEKLPEDGRLTWDSSPAKHVRAVLATQSHDVVLPNRPVDLRVSRSNTSILSDPGAVAAIREFIDASLFDLDVGALRTPAVLKIPQNDVAGLFESDSDAQPAGHFEFVGLEIRRSIVMEYEGHHLKYTSVEAGLHGGRRVELSLDMVPSAADGDAEATSSRRQYLDLAARLAGDHLVKWVGGDGSRPGVITRRRRAAKGEKSTQRGIGRPTRRQARARVGV